MDLCESVARYIAVISYVRLVDVLFRVSFLSMSRFSDLFLDNGRGEACARAVQRGLYFMRICIAHTHTHTWTRVRTSTLRSHVRHGERARGFMNIAHFS